MNIFNPVLEERITFLEHFSNSCREILRHSPKGHLRVSNEKNRCQYFHVTEETGKNGRYLRQKQITLRDALALKDYSEQALSAAMQELNLLKKLRRDLPEVPAEDIYDHIHPSRKCCFQPIWLPDDQYAKQWLETSFRTKGVGENVPEFFTDNGERVRSKSEVLIADKLKKMDIPYRYECELKLNTGRIIYPDFTVLNVRKRTVYYYEHFGRMDDPEYVQNVMQRLEWYRQDGIIVGDQLFITWETKDFPLSMRSAEQLYRAAFL